MFVMLPPLKEIRNIGEKYFAQKLVDSFRSKTYYAINSLGLEAHETKQYGEADFVLITDLGIFCLEVKGGSIKREQGVWTIGDSYTSSEGPFKQAQGTIHPIMKCLQRSDAGRARKFPIGWGVVFPNNDFNETDPEWGPYHICNSIRIEDIEGFLIELAENRKIQLLQTTGISFKENITQEDMKWALKSLRPNISALSLSSISSSKQEIYVLEERQKIFVDSLVLGEENRHLISGGPGTGKTFLILEAILSLPPDNKILLLCFNRNLANHLSHSLIENKNVEISTYHSFARKIVGHKTYDQALDKAKSINNFFKLSLPNLIDNALLELEKTKQWDKYDWIMVDEGQDLPTDEIIDTMDFLLEDGLAKGNFIFCYDENVQAEIYDSFDPHSLKQLERVAQKHHYRRNYRNPKSIAKRAAKIVGEKDVHTARNFSSLPRLHSCANENKALESKLNELVSSLIENGAKPSDISILTFQNKEKTSLRAISKISGIPFANQEYYGVSKDSIMWSTVASFKGLENEIVFLVEGSELNLDNWHKSLLYVALTRTKTEFHYIGEEGNAIWRAIS